MTPAPVTPTGEDDLLARLGFQADQIVQEFGYDSDVDDDFRQQIEQRCGGELEDDDYTGETDAVLLWWRAEDGDLGDALMDVVGLVEGGGFVVVLTPKPGTPGAMEASAMDEAAQTAGLHGAGTFKVGKRWRAAKLVATKGRSKR